MSARQVVRSRLSFFFFLGDTPAPDKFLFRELTPAPDRYLGENTDPPVRSVPPTSDFFREHTPAPDIYLGGTIRTLPDAPFSNPLSGSIPPDVREDIAPLNSILVYVVERGYRY